MHIGNICLSATMEVLQQIESSSTLQSAHMTTQSVGGLPDNKPRHMDSATVTETVSSATMSTTVTDNYDDLGLDDITDNTFLEFHQTLSNGGATMASNSSMADILLASDSNHKLAHTSTNSSSLVGNSKTADSYVTDSQNCDVYVADSKTYADMASHLGDSSEVGSSGIGDNPSGSGESGAREQEESPEVNVAINNVVCTFSTRCHLNLRHIALNGYNVELKKAQGMLNMKLRKPSATASIWSSGKITVTGANSEDNCKIAARRIARKIQKIGFNVS